MTPLESRHNNTTRNYHGCLTLNFKAFRVKIVSGKKFLRFSSKIKVEVYVNYRTCRERSTLESVVAVRIKFCDAILKFKTKISPFVMQIPLKQYMVENLKNTDDKRLTSTKYQWTSSSNA